MHAEKSNFTVVRMARLLGVSRSGYYALAKRIPSQRAMRAALTRCPPNGVKANPTAPPETNPQPHAHETASPTS
jgi:hypothetical protein